MSISARMVQVASKPPSCLGVGRVVLVVVDAAAVNTTDGGEPRPLVLSRRERIAGIAFALPEGGQVALAAGGKPASFNT
jgi:hypothetical protein